MEEATISWNFGIMRHCANIRNASAFILVKFLRWWIGGAWPPVAPLRLRPCCYPRLLIAGAVFVLFDELHCGMLRKCGSPHLTVTAAKFDH